ncbi:MAG: hypothetical protein CR993_03105 [Rhodobacterales bacterium]|nr:MAG: hypothetical protein CR993_03105 [Rhodobacterales bacterium]
MTKLELIKALAEECNTTAGAAESLLDGLARVASKKLGEGGEVIIPGLVKLTTKERAARKGRNPRTGEEVAIPAKTVVHVKVLKALAEHVV